MAEKTPEDRQNSAVTKHFSREQLENMKAKDLLDLLGNLPPGAKFHAKGVVRDKDGNVKYDDPELKGSYDEL